MIIDFPLGLDQRFRRRTDDVTIQGRLHAAQFPIRQAAWQLNGGNAVHLYIEHVPDILLRAGRNGSWHATPVDWRTGYKDSPAGLRLKRLGDFVVEIPIDSSDLRAGSNELRIDIEDHGKTSASRSMRFDWDPTPVPLALDLSDLSDALGIQDIGQIINGSFTVDRATNSIVSATPADPDSLLLVGSPHGSQEATYRVVFGLPGEAKYLGLSDFFVRNEDEVPPIGVRPGYSTAGLATVRFDGEARSWIALGDNGHRTESWLVFTDPAATFHARQGQPYRVRHQVLFGAEHRTRFRIWPEGEPEPAGWLCEETDAAIPSHLPRFSAASFGLFMHTGIGTAWSDIRVAALAESEVRAS